MRALYKDLLCLLNENRLISAQILRAKMEPSVFGDRLRSHGPRTNSRQYKEERIFRGFRDITVSFYFLTHVFDDYVKDVLKYITSKEVPDVILINSCLWDLTRWGAEGVGEYKRNIVSLLKRLQICTPDSLVIWLTTPPISKEVSGGFLIPDLQFLKFSLRFHVVEANTFARKVVVEHGFDVVDCHHHLKFQIHRRARDGVHWNPEPVRYMTNLILTHISLAWNVDLPHRFKSLVIEETLEQLNKDLIEEASAQKKKVPDERSHKSSYSSRHRVHQGDAAYSRPGGSQRTDYGHFSSVPFREMGRHSRSSSRSESQEGETITITVHSTSEDFHAY